jgi:16S rRNA (adenine1518-N6/adenine1519-N6)-dimethyltransferase
VTNLGCDEQLFRRIVKTVFNQRRKMLRVSLRQLLSADAIATLDADLTLRPEQLSIQQFVDLTNHIAPLITP